VRLIVDKGILEAFLYDSQTARKAGVKVNTMATRGGDRRDDGELLDRLQRVLEVDGAITHPVDGVTLGGSALEILNGIDRVADDLDMRGGVNSPSFRIAEITVGGRKG
jgi:predicted Zn-dependent protease